MSGPIICQGTEQTIVQCDSSSQLGILNSIESLPVLTCDGMFLVWSPAPSLKSGPFTY